MTNQCEHGQLKGQCQICEMQVELDELSEDLSKANAENDRLQSECYESREIIKELETKVDRLEAHCDLHYIAGMKAGKNYCVDDDSEGMQKAIENRQRYALPELRQI